MSVVKILSLRPQEHLAVLACPLPELKGMLRGVPGRRALDYIRCEDRKVVFHSTIGGPPRHLSNLTAQEYMAFRNMITDWEGSQLCQVSLHGERITRCTDKGVPLIRVWSNEGCMRSVPVPRWLDVEGVMEPNPSFVPMDSSHQIIYFEGQHYLLKGPHYLTFSYVRDLVDVVYFTPPQALMDFYISRIKVVEVSGLSK